MAVYTIRLSGNEGEFGVVLVDGVLLDQPFAFGPDDVVTLIAEVKDHDTGIAYSGNGTCDMGVIFHTEKGNAAVYLPDIRNGVRVSPRSDSNMTGDNPYQAEIRRGDLFAPVYGNGASIITHNDDIPLYGIDKTGVLVVYDIRVENRQYDWQSDNDYFLTFITPDGGASKFWTGFRGCRELI